MKKRPTISRLKAIAWKACSLYIRLRDSDWKGYVKCCTCNKFFFWKNVDAGHFVSRRYNATLFDERNVHAQCKGCNITGEPDAYALFLISRYGDGIIEELNRLKKMTYQFTVSELESITAKFKKKTAALGTKMEI